MDAQPYALQAAQPAATTAWSKVKTALFILICISILVSEIEALLVFFKDPFYYNGTKKYLKKIGYDWEGYWFSCILSFAIKCLEFFAIILEWYCPIIYFSICYWVNILGSIIYIIDGHTIFIPDLFLAIPMAILSLFYVSELSAKRVFNTGFVLPFYNEKEAPKEEEEEDSVSSTGTATST